MVVENLQTSSRRNLAHRGRMEVVRKIAVSRLHEDCGVGKALGVDTVVYVDEAHPFTDMSSSILNGGVPIDIRKQSQAESGRIL